MMRSTPTKFLLLSIPSECDERRGENEIRIWPEDKSE